jgi:hypothetical protein
MRVALEARDAQLRHSLQRVADADQLAASLRAAVAVRDSELWAKVHPSCIMHRASFLQASYMPHASVHAACIMHPSCIVPQELQLQAYENSLDHSLGLTVSMSSYPQPPASSPSSGVDQHSMHEVRALAHPSLG